MYVLIVAATIQEVLPFIKTIMLKEKVKSKFYVGEYKKYKIDLLITGIGMVFTAYNLTKMISLNKYDFAVNIGIAGSFKKDLAIGEVVNVIEDEFSEMGAEDGDKFISIKDLQVVLKNDKNMRRSRLFNSLKNSNNTIVLYRRVKGITVNTVHGNEKSISDIVRTNNPDIETMEGASFMYICLSENIKFIQLRSISNYIERRNKDHWNIPLAIQNINNALIILFEKEIL